MGYTPWIILDRDGVINYDSDDFIRSPDEWVPLPGSIEAIARLSRAGWHVTVATNQSGVYRGLISEETLVAIHRLLESTVESAGGKITALVYCPHGPSNGCSCRKPKPGMYQKLARQLGHELTDVPVVGDSPRDLEAAVAVGARPMLVRTGKGEMSIGSDVVSQAEIFQDLSQVVDFLLQQEQ
ncbi:D-glycero-beta-D-manno-heptose-1,7-bisphosphate 7-phosphatase [Halorhodospira halochloris]|nr:D-glycero-beta-D-manno-heptose-1,7-bisphosphate 7-phosphatase [Halorhodospira halochloris]